MNNETSSTIVTNNEDKLINDTTDNKENTTNDIANNELIEVIEKPQETPFIEKKFNDYTITETLLFLILITLIIAFIFSFFKIKN